MTVLKTYTPDMQKDIEAFFSDCFNALQWNYEPNGRHADTLNIASEYVSGGEFWCLYNESVLAGTVAIKALDSNKTICEMKRLYVLPEFQRMGYGELLFKTALNFAKESGFRLIRLDTRKDRDASRHLIEKHRFKKIEKYNSNSFAELFYELDLNDHISN